MFSRRSTPFRSSSQWSPPRKSSSKRAFFWKQRRRTIPTRSRAGEAQRRPWPLQRLPVGDAPPGTVGERGSSVMATSDPSAEQHRWEAALRDYPHHHDAGICLDKYDYAFESTAGAGNISRQVCFVAPLKVITPLGTLLSSARLWRVRTFRQEPEKEPHVERGHGAIKYYHGR